MVAKNTKNPLFLGRGNQRKLEIRIKILYAEWLNFKHSSMPAKTHAEPSRNVRTDMVDGWGDSVGSEDRHTKTDRLDRDERFHGQAQKTQNFCE